MNIVEELLGKTLEKLYETPCEIVLNENNEEV